MVVKRGRSRGHDRDRGRRRRRLRLRYRRRRQSDRGKSAFLVVYPPSFENGAKKKKQRKPKKKKMFIYRYAHVYTEEVYVQNSRFLHLLLKFCIIVDMIPSSLSTSREREKVIIDKREEEKNSTLFTTM